VIFNFIFSMVSDRDDMNYMKKRLYDFPSSLKTISMFLLVP
jgi:hypothetical protein